MAIWIRIREDRRNLGLIGHAIGAAFPTQQVDGRRQIPQLRPAASDVARPSLVGHDRRAVLGLVKLIHCAATAGSDSGTDSGLASSGAAATTSSGCAAATVRRPSELSSAAVEATPPVMYRTRFIMS